MGDRTVARHAAGPRRTTRTGYGALFDAKAARWPAKYAPDGRWPDGWHSSPARSAPGSAMAANCSTSAAAAVSSRGTWRRTATG